MKRREFIQTLAGGAVAALIDPSRALAAPGRDGSYDNLLVLVELRGGNDGLNTVVPYADRAYYDLRPRIAIARDQVLQLDSNTGLHPSLQPLLTAWQAQELAVVQGIGYPHANQSHFRSIEIWDTASASEQYLSDGWLTRAFAAAPVPRSFVADAVTIGDNEMGPFAGGGTRALALTNPDQFLRQAKFAQAGGASPNAALNHILKVENDVVQAASHLNTSTPFRTVFPNGQFGNALKTAAQVIANKAGVAAVRVSLGSFDTHSNQPATQARLLKELAEGLAAMRLALQEINRWNSTLMMTYTEFGRRARENQSNGTDHGTANAHLILGGRVRGGLYGAPPALTRLDGNGNLPFAVDFRDMYATVLDRWWGVDSAAVLGGRFKPVDVLKA